MPKVSCIAQSLLQRYPKMEGRQLQHLETLTLLIADRVADELVVMRFRRFFKHDTITYECWMLLVAQALLIMPAR